MVIEIRPALPSEAAEIGALIVQTLHSTNAADYSAENIERVARSFSTDAILELMRHRKMFVATSNGKIVGTASLDGRVVRTVFVASNLQGHGIGKRLMDAVEHAAREAGGKILAVPSSITAEGFYARLGFLPVRDAYHGDERTIIMERCLPPEA